MALLHISAVMKHGGAGQPQPSCFLTVHDRSREIQCASMALLDKQIG